MINEFAAIIGAVLAVFSISQVQASVISQQGRLNNPDQLFAVEFSLSTPSTVNIQGYGYGGGTNGSGELISSGGFDTVISLFTGSGPSATLIAFNDDGICPPGSFDPVTGGCLDSTLTRDLLLAGTYTIVLSASFRLPTGSILGNGFSGEGSFVDVFGDSRTCNYAFDVSVGSLQVVPEPPTSNLILVPILLVISAHIRKIRSGDLIYLFYRRQTSIFAPERVFNGV
jgi:hypothetical protein